MKLTDEEEVEMQKMKNEKMKKMVIILIILLIILGVIIAIVIVYRINNPTTITTYIDGVVVQGFDQIVDFQEEDGEIELYIPIREFASYLNTANSDFGYQTFKGDYDPKTEDEDKCHVIREKYEVAIFTKESKTIYKLDLQSKSSEYEECTIDKSVYESNGQLYASQDGIEKGYNVIITYDDNKKIIQIYTLDYLIESYQAALEGKSIGEYGELEISTDSYSNWKSIFDGLLIVESSSGKYGIIKISDYSLILEPQYDKISYVNDSSTFLVESNSKVGLFSEEGKRKIDLIYDEIISIGQNSNLYVVKSDKLYGIVDENGNIIIYPEYDGIGIDVSSFSYNDIKTGYILLDDVIPVEQDDKWALFNLEGEMLTEGFVYSGIGCTNVKSGNNLYPLLQIEEYNVIIVQDEDGMYSFVNTEGELLFQFLFDQVYIKVSEGEVSYWMIYKNKEYDVTIYLEQVKQN